ncbi:MAG: peptide chain release factor N(5)-glutamine methyltransferase [Planctomycetota bacterium]|jgi:release factor glutamine methyltransferase
MTSSRESLRAASEQLRSRGVESASTEAVLLLAHVLGVPREKALLEDLPLDAGDLRRFRDFVDRRAETREPFAYIVGAAGFFGLDLEVTRDVLIPRPATEVLVERALEVPAKTAADIGTGTGAIAIALAAHRPGLRVAATDTSSAILDVAHRNAVRCGVEHRIDFLQGSLLEPLDAPVDLLICNPPYVRRDVLKTLAPEIRHEPAAALDGGPDGLDFVRPLIAGARAKLRPSGTLMLELGHDQSKAARTLASEAGFRSVEIHKDLEGIDRILRAK